MARQHISKTTCRKCGCQLVVGLTQSQYYARINDGICQRCSNARARGYARSRSISKSLRLSAQQRARRGSIPFTITVDDVVVPEKCPVLGVTLERGQDAVTNPNSPSLDRLSAPLGYVPGNIAVISHRANRMKNDATLEELELLVAWLKSQG